MVTQPGNVVAQDGTSLTKCFPMLVSSMQLEFTLIYTAFLRFHKPKLGKLQATNIKIANELLSSNAAFLESSSKTQFLIPCKEEKMASLAVAEEKKLFLSSLRSLGSFLQP